MLEDTQSLVAVAVTWPLVVHVLSDPYQLFRPEGGASSHSTTRRLELAARRRSRAPNHLEYPSQCRSLGNGPVPGSQHVKGSLQCRISK